VKIPKPTEADVAYFRVLLPDQSEVSIRPMFGNLGAFVNGNMFMGLFGSSIGVQLADADREKLLAVADTGPFGPEERPMGGYVAMPEAWRAAPQKARPWIAKSLEHVKAMPPKKPRKA
jgi:TfoX/Sxy family transcriptional regulator of competence genes